MKKYNQIIICLFILKENLKGKDFRIICNCATQRIIVQKVNSKLVTFFYFYFFREKLVRFERNLKKLFKRIIYRIDDFYHCD